MDTIPGPGLRLTRIIATIGPACSDIGTIHDMIRAGMDIARLNLSHGTFEEHQEVLIRIRLAAREADKLVAILIDIPGPKLRVRTLPDENRPLFAGDEIVLSATPSMHELGVGPDIYIPSVFPGDTILIGDGAVTAQVIEGGKTIRAQITGGGIIRPGAGIVIPGRRPDIPYANDELRKNIAFAAKQNPDFIALSFVSSASDIIQAQDIIRQAGSDAPLIAKIETGLAVDRFDEILAVSDGIMVARGDLGVELPLSCIPHIQKDIIRRCNIAGVPVITATEMLESMVHQSRPTRAEVTDVANAIADGTDATMLSAETSIGSNPERAVRTMAEIACETEKHLPYQQMLSDREVFNEKSPEGMISYSACFLVNRLEGRAIVAFTRSGLTAVRVSRCRPKSPIIAITPDETVARRLLIRWAIIPCIHEPINTADELFRISLHLTQGRGLTQAGDYIIVIAGNFAGAEGTTNMIKVQRVA